MRINHNIPALRSLHQLNKSNSLLDKSLERLSSGLRINNAADDAAGLAITQKMDTQVKGLEQANRNAMDGISLIQTAEGALSEVQSMLQRMRELAVQASNGTYNDEDRANIQLEVSQLNTEIDRISEDTEFNEKKLLNGDLELMPLDLQIGANEGQNMDVEIPDTSTIGLGINTIDLSTSDNAESAISVINDAIIQISTTRSKLGAYQNRLEHTVANLGTAAENMTGAMSRIQDADMAYEMAQYTQRNILTQAGTSMLAQANQRPQSILQLLQG